MPVRPAVSLYLRSVKQIGLPCEYKGNRTGISARSTARSGFIRLGIGGVAYQIEPSSPTGINGRILTGIAPTDFTVDPDSSFPDTLFGGNHRSGVVSPGSGKYHGGLKLRLRLAACRDRRPRRYIALQSGKLHRNLLLTHQRGTVRVGATCQENSRQAEKDKKRNMAFHDHGRHFM